MFRTMTLGLAAIAASAAFISAEAQAKPFPHEKAFPQHKSFTPQKRFDAIKIVKLPKPFPKPVPKNIPKHKPHSHGPMHGVYVTSPAYVVERPAVRSIGVVSERAVARNTCNCLTKDYTPDGVVLFKDLCTQEMASAPLPGSPAAALQQSGEAPAPANYAGKTFEEFKAAQAAGEPSKN